MADRERDASVGVPASDGDPVARAPHPPRLNDDQSVEPAPCPECAFPRPTLVSDGDIVSVFKCPRCGHLSAPVKSS